MHLCAALTNTSRSVLGPNPLRRSSIFIQRSCYANAGRPSSSIRITSFAASPSGHREHQREQRSRSGWQCHEHYSGSSLFSRSPRSTLSPVCNQIPRSQCLLCGVADDQKQVSFPGFSQCIDISSCSSTVDSYITEGDQVICLSRGSSYGI